MSWVLDLSILLSVSVCIHMFGLFYRATCSFVSTSMFGISHAIQNIKKWKTSAVSTTDWMVETQLCKLRGTSDTFVGRAYSIYISFIILRVWCLWTKPTMWLLIRTFTLKRSITAVSCFRRNNPFFPFFFSTSRLQVLQGMSVKTFTQTFEDLTA